MRIKKLIGVPFVLGSLVALFAMADAAMATHTAPIGASPVRVSLVPSFRPCETGSSNSTHGPPLSFPSCNPPVLTSTTTKIGPQAIGFARLIVCPAPGPFPTGNPCNVLNANLPDVRLQGDGKDIQCIATGTPAGCTAGGPYNPTGNGTLSPYTTAGNGQPPTPFCNPDATSASDCIAGTDITATAELATEAGSIGGQGNFAGHAIRVSDHYNCGPLLPPGDPNACPADPVTSTRAATMTDLQFPVAVSCLPGVGTAGSDCGVNTTANAIVPGSVIANKQAVVEIGEIILKDSGPNGIRDAAGAGDDQVFSAQGLFLP